MVEAECWSVLNLVIFEVALLDVGNFVRAMVG